MEILLEEYSLTEHTANRSAQTAQRQDQTQLVERDVLLDELRARVPEIAAEMTPKLKEIQLHRVEQRTDAILAATNAVITELRAVRTALNREGLRLPSGRDRHVKLAESLLAGNLLLAAAAPVAMWQSWSYLATRSGWGAALLIQLAGVVAVALVNGTCFWLVQRSHTPGNRKSFGFLGVTLSILLIELTGAGLVIWRFWEPSHRNLGLLAWILWVLGAFGALIIIGFTVGLVSDFWYPDRPQERRRPDIKPLSALLLRSVSRFFLVVLVGIGALRLAGNQLAEDESAAIRFAGATAFTAILLTAFGPPAYQYLLKRILHTSVYEYERLRSREVAALRAWRYQVEAEIRNLIAQDGHEETQALGFSTALNAYKVMGLRQMRAPDHVVGTTTFKKFARMLEHVGGGAIGIAGPRGAGKTTLLEAYCSGRFLPAGQKHLVVSESVPVKYDAREFALHLYAALCTAVINFVDEELGHRPRKLQRYVRWTLSRFPIVVVALGWLSIGYAGGNALRRTQDLGSWIADMWWPFFLISLAVGVMFAVFRRRQRHVTVAASAAEITSASGLRSFAESRLSSIRFQQRHTQGWSGKLALPFGGDVSRTTSVEFARQAMTYPEIVRDMRDFLRSSVDVFADFESIAAPSIVIAIDELDKIPNSLQAQEFINEIKALFGMDVPGCLFLVSISEEAMSFYEKEGVSFRDVANSAFDMIFQVEYLSLPDTRAILRHRIPDIGEPFACLCHSLGGGLARDVVRIARTMLEAEDYSLTSVCEFVVGRDLKLRLSSLSKEIAQLQDMEPHTSELLNHLQAYGTPNEGRLIAGLHAWPVKQGTAISGPSADRWLRLQLDAASYFYHYATLLAVFDSRLTEHDVRRADMSQVNAFEVLAGARRRIESNSELAWQMISSFRHTWNWFHPQDSGRGLERLPSPPGSVSQAAMDHKAEPDL